MCFAPDNQFFWIVTGLLVGLSLLCFFTLRQFIKQLRNAKSPLMFAEVVMDHIPALVINGIWLFMAVTVAGACFY